MDFMTSKRTAHLDSPMQNSWRRQQIILQHYVIYRLPQVVLAAVLGCMLHLLHVNSRNLT